MTVVNCPKCKEQVRLPVEPESEIHVRCPLCLHEYCSLELLAALPPSLIVLDSAEEFAYIAPADAVPTDAEAESPLPAADGATRQLGLKDFEFATSPPPSLRTKRQSRSLRDGRRKKNPAIEVIKIVAGGVAGLVIGQLILWWGFARDPLDAGPRVARMTPWAVPASFRGTSSELDLGPVVPDDSDLAAGQDTDGQFQLPSIEFAAPIGVPMPSNANTNTDEPEPFIMRPIAVETKGLEDTAGPTGTGPTDASPTGLTGTGLTGTGLPGTGLSGTEQMPLQSAFDGVDDGNRVGDARPLEGPEGGDTANAENVTRSQGDGSDTAEINRSTLIDRGDETEPLEIPVIEIPVEIPVIEPAGDSVGDTKSPISLEQPIQYEEGLVTAALRDRDAANASLEQQSGLVGLAAVSIAELENQLAVAESAAQQWDDAGEVDVSTRRSLAAQLYQAIAEMGDMLVRVDDADRSNKLDVRVQELVEAIGQDVDKKLLVQHGAPSWIAAKGPGHGVVVFGTILSAAKSGDLIEVELELQPNLVLTVVSRADPKDDLRKDNKVFVLGKMLATPRETLAGYTGLGEYPGPAESVIWAAFHCADPSSLASSESGERLSKH